MARSVGVVDYGMGNLQSLSRALDFIGAKPFLTNDPDAVRSADYLVLPGVGAFGACAANLRSAGMVEPILDFVKAGKPFLGICVGMQLLFDCSFEFGSHVGLGLISGLVSAIPSEGPNRPRKIPHIGWGTLQLPAARQSWAGTLFDRMEPGRSAAYFIHSYSAQPRSAADTLGMVDYHGYEICAAVQRDNVIGLQFHPEKSSSVGLAILSRFLD